MITMKQKHWRVLILKHLKPWWRSIFKRWKDRLAGNYSSTLGTILILGSRGRFGTISPSVKRCLAQREASSWPRTEYSTSKSYSTCIKQIILKPMRVFWTNKALKKCLRPAAKMRVFLSMQRMRLSLTTASQLRCGLDFGKRYSVRGRRKHTSFWCIQGILEDRWSMW